MSQCALGISFEVSPSDADQDRTIIQLRPCIVFKTQEITYREPLELHFRGCLTIRRLSDQGSVWQAWLSKEFFFLHQELIIASALRAKRLHTVRRLDDTHYQW